MSDKNMLFYNVKKSGFITSSMSWYLSGHAGNIFFFFDDDVSTTNQNIQIDCTFDCCLIYWRYFFKKIFSEIIWLNILLKMIVF